MKHNSIVPEDVLGNLGEKLREISNEGSIKQSIPSEISPLQRGAFNSSLEEAGRTLISVLPSPLHDYIIELANVTLHIPVWQLLLGSVVAQNESGNLTAPSIDPAWGQVEFVVGESTCQYHGCQLPNRKFTPQRIGQVFCSNKCGDADRLEKMLVIRAKRMSEDTKKRQEIDDSGIEP